MRILYTFQNHTIYIHINGIYIFGREGMKMNFVKNRKQAKTVDIKTKTEEKLKQQLKKEENSTTKLIIACFVHYGI